MCEKRDPAKGAEIARLVAQQREDQRLDQAGQCKIGVECTTGLRFDEGLVRIGDRTQTSEWVEVHRVDKAYHGGSSVADRVDRMNL